VWHDRRVLSAVSIVARLASELVGWVALAFQSRQSLQAEVLFLRRQLALYVERGIKPRRIDPVTRISLAILSRFCNWRDALVVVRPETMIRWHSAGWKLFWRLKSRPGRSPIPQPLQALIRRMANEIPLSASHLRSILKSWIPHYNAGRPHMALGPGVPDRPPACRDYQKAGSRHRHGESYAVRANPILGGLHHEYSLVPSCA